MLAIKSESQKTPTRTMPAAVDRRVELAVNDELALNTRVSQPFDREFDKKKRPTISVNPVAKQPRWLYTRHGNHHGSSMVPNTSIFELVQA